MSQIRICGSQPFNPSRLNHGCREKIKINFYFHTSLWWLKMVEAFEVKLLRHYKEV